jgi:hypothetical protein
MRRAKFAGQTSVEVLGGLPHRQRQAGIEERRVDVLSAAGARAPMKRREDAGERKQSGAEIGDGQTDLHRWTSGLAGDGHDAARALRDEIETAFGGGRPGLTVAGNRRIDQPRIRGGQRGVIEAQPLHHTRAEVLDQHVGPAGHLCERRATRGGLQIEHDAALAAVDGVERAAVASARASHRARRVTGRWLDFDHARAHVAQ